MLMKHPELRLHLEGYTGAEGYEAHNLPYGA